MKAPRIDAPLRRERVQGRLLCRQSGLDYLHPVKTLVELCLFPVDADGDAGIRIRVNVFAVFLTFIKNIVDDVKRHTLTVEDHLISAVIEKGSVEGLKIQMRKLIQVKFVRDHLHIREGTAGTQNEDVALLIPFLEGLPCSCFRWYRTDGGAYS